LVAHHGGEVVAHLEALDEKRARALGDAARRRILAEHTYNHRARQLAELLDAIPSGRSRTQKNRHTEKDDHTEKLST
jgi:spore maturation protein CgeB